MQTDFNGIRIRPFAFPFSLSFTWGYIVKTTVPILTPQQGLTDLSSTSEGVKHKHEKSVWPIKQNKKAPVEGSAVLKKQDQTQGAKLNLYFPFLLRCCFFFLQLYFKQGPRPCSTEQRRLFCLRFCWQNVMSLQDPLRHRPRQDSQRVSPGGSSKRSSSSLRWYKGDGHKHDLNLSFSTSLKREKSISSPVFRAFCQAMPSYSQSPSPSSKYQQKNLKAAGIRLRKPPLITRLCNVLLQLDLLVFFKLLKTTF